MRFNAIILFVVLAMGWDVDAIGKKIAKSGARNRRRSSDTDDDDSFCLNTEVQPATTVRTQDCPHNCCVSGECGTSDQCKAAIIVIVVVIIVLVLCCCFILLIVLALYCTKKACFKESKPPQSPQYEYPQYQQPQQGYQSPVYGQPQQDYSYPPPPQYQQAPNAGYY